MPLTEEHLVHVPGFLSRWVRLANGARAHYMTAGETGPAVILLHGGLPGSSGTAGWRFMAPFLGAYGFRVYCPDQPAFGLSDERPEYWPTHGTMSHVEFVTQFADALCLDEFYLGGNSMGCINASHYAVRSPHRVLRLALIAGAVGDHVRLDLQQEARVDVRPDAAGDTYMQDMMKAIISRPGAVDDDLLAMRAHAAERHQEAWNVFHRQVMLGEMTPDVQLALSTKDRISRLSIPTIYLWGTDDVIMPMDPLGYQQEDALPDIQFFYPEQCGHQGQTDQPELFNQVFLEFFRDGRVSRDTAERAGMSQRRPPLAHLVDGVSEVTVR